MYVLLSLTNGKFYLGSTTRSFKRRWEEHFSELNKGTHKSTHLQNAWNKYSYSNFKFIVIESLSNKDIVLEKEQYYLDISDKSLLLNCSPSARGCRGVKKTEEFKKKISASLIGNERTRGRPLSKEHKESIRNSLKGRELSPEWKKRIANSKKDIFCKITAIHLGSEGSILVFESINEAARELNMYPAEVHGVLRGRRKTARGWYFIPCPI